MVSIRVGLERARAVSAVVHTPHADPHRPQHLTAHTTPAAAPHSAHHASRSTSQRTSRRPQQALIPPAAAPRSPSQRTPRQPQQLTAHITPAAAPHSAHHASRSPSQRTSRQPQPLTTHTTPAAAAHSAYPAGRSTSQRTPRQSQHLPVVGSRDTATCPHTPQHLSARKLFYCRMLCVLDSAGVCWVCVVMNFARDRKKSYILCMLLILCPFC